MVTIGKFKLHYAWVVLFAACMLNIASRADHGSFGVFVEPLVELFGWSRGDISAACSIAFVVGLPAVVIMGWLGDRYGARPLMIGAALLITAGTYLLGTITELWQFYAYDVLVLRGIHAAAERIGHFPEFGFIADVCAVGFSNWSSSSPPLFCPLFLLCRPRSNPSQPRPGRNYPFLHDYKNGAKYAVGDSLTGEHHPHSALPYQGGWNMIVVRVARSGRKNQ